MSTLMKSQPIPLLEVGQEPASRGDRAAEGPPGPSRRIPSVGTLLVAAAIAWACWSLVGEMGRKWSTDPTYSHGFLVPLMSLWILWARRDAMPTGGRRGPWAGVALFALGGLMQVGGAFLYIRWLSGAAILAYLAGLALLSGGRAMLRWAAPAIAFLLFMIPLPYRLEVLVKGPMQRISTVASAFALETLGIPALSEGNVIVLDEVDLGVVDACSGMKLLIVFFALSTAMAILSKRGAFERAIIVLSALPIALISNIARITATGFLYETSSRDWAELVYHDLAGWLMMPLAIVLLWSELGLLSLVIEDETTPDGPAMPGVAGLVRAENGASS